MSLLSFPSRVLPPTLNVAEWEWPSSVDVAATNPAITCRRIAISMPPAIDPIARPTLELMFDIVNGDQPA
jgi:hypothetical protein